MTHPASLLPLLGLLAVLAGMGHLGAAESGQPQAPNAQDRLTQQALILHAKDEGYRQAAAAARRRSATPTPTRAAAATPLSIGTLTIASPSDPTQVARFSKLELVVPVTTGVASTSFFNPNPAAGGITLAGTFVGPAATWTIPGYYDGTNWRIRFAPDTAGSWSCSATVQDGTGMQTSSSVGFTVVASSSHGWVKAVGNHLAYSFDGTPFVGIGHNNGFLENVEQPTIASMPVSGENVLSFWLANPFGSSIRNPIEASTVGGGAGIGIYDQGACATIDGLFAHAEQVGVLLLPSIWSHNQLNNGIPNWGSPQWLGLAYSQIIDPSTTNPIQASDFFTIQGSGGAPTAQWTYQQNFYRYLIARWGYSTSLLGWVGAVELDGTAYTQDPAAGNLWCGSVTGFFALNDPYRGSGSASGAYPISFSMSDADDTQPFNQGFSMLIMDSYLEQANSTLIAATIASETISMHGLGLPCFHSEFGAKVSNPDTLEPLHFHNALWAGIAAGAALTPLKYCDGVHWPLISDSTLGPAYQAAFAQLAAFLGTVPYTGSANVTSAQLAVSGVVQSVGGATLTVNAWGQALSDRAFAWLQAVSINQSTHAVSSAVLSSGTLTVSGLNDGPYQATWYDPWATTLTPVGAPATVSSSGGTMAIPIATSPNGNADLALSLRHLPTAANLAVSVVATTAQAITLSGSAGGDALSGAAISTLPVSGRLNQTDDGTTPGAAITAAPAAVTTSAPAAPMVIYTAGAATGSDSFTYTVADGALVSPPATVTVTIVPVNQAPTFALPATSISLNEGVQVASLTYPGWATQILNGAGDLSTLTGFTVTSDQPAMFANPPAIDLSGTLTFTLQGDAFSPGNPPPRSPSPRS